MNYPEQNPLNLSLACDNGSFAPAESLSATTSYNSHSWPGTVLVVDSVQPVCPVILRGSLNANMETDSGLPTLECVIDHIVLLVSQKDFDNPPPWLSNNFKVLEGGVHSGILHHLPHLRILQAHL
jgi:hypothetical protein